nr:MAG TPA: hypothetical protein [Caudoviricetes sp.]
MKIISSFFMAKNLLKFISFFQFAGIPPLYPVPASTALY